MSAAVAHAPNNLFGLIVPFDRDHLNTHRHCPLAFEATDRLGEVDNVCDMGVFSGYFSNQFAHGSPPDTRFTTTNRASHLRVVAGQTDAAPADR